MLRNLDTSILDPRKIEDVSQCRICANLGLDHVPSEGAINASVMIIGQSPGAREVEQGRPFVGPCGEMLDLMLDRAGLSRNEVYIANTLKCRPPANRAGLPGEIRNCKQQWLAHEIKAVNPRLIILLGKDAYKSIIPQGTKDFEHKGIITSKSGRQYMMLYHPSWFLRRGATMDFIMLGDFLAQTLNSQEE